MIDYAMRSGAPLEVIENLQEMEVRNMYWSVPVIMILLICMHKVLVWYFG